MMLLIYKYFVYQLYMLLNKPYNPTFSNDTDFSNPTIELAPNINPNYFDKQGSGSRGASCGRNTLNNFFGNEYFINNTIEGSSIERIDNNISTTIRRKQINLEEVCRYLTEYNKTNLTSGQIGELCDSTEYYSYSVLSFGLTLMGYESKMIIQHHMKTNTDSNIKKILDNPSFRGFCVNTSGGHWISARKNIDNKYNCIDSLSSVKNISIKTYDDLSKYHSLMTITFIGKINKYSNDKKELNLYDIILYNNLIYIVINIKRDTNINDFGISPIISINISDISNIINNKKNNKIDDINILFQNLKYKNIGNLNNSKLEYITLFDGDISPDPIEFISGKNILNYNVTVDFFNILSQYEQLFNAYLLNKQIKKMLDEISHSDNILRKYQQYLLDENEKFINSFS